MVPRLIAVIDCPDFATEIHIDGDKTELLEKKSSLLTIWSVAPESSKNIISLTLACWIECIFSIINAKPSASAMFDCTVFKCCA